jgi:hypothetical protein
MDNIENEEYISHSSGHNTLKQESEQNKKIPICKGNFCMICGVNMGDDNPRQLCGKTYCMQEDN